MARADSTPVPVMNQGTAAATAGAKAAGTGATKGSGSGSTSKKVRHLSGPWGASFDGKTADGKLVHGLSWPRRFTTPGTHPYDEIEWELRTAGIANESGKSVF
jgi:hypothetical protein